MKRTIPVIRVTRETLENLMKSRAGLVQQRVWVKDSGNKKGHWRMQWVQPGTGKTDATAGQMELFGGDVHPKVKPAEKKAEKKPEPDKPQSQAMRDIDDRKKRIDEIKKEYAGKELPNHAQIELRMHQSVLSDLYKEAGIKPDSETEGSEISRMLNESSRGKEHYDDDTAEFQGRHFDPETGAEFDEDGNMKKPSRLREAWELYEKTNKERQDANIKYGSEKHKRVVLTIEGEKFFVDGYAGDMTNDGDHFYLQSVDDKAYKHYPSKELSGKIDDIQVLALGDVKRSLKTKPDAAGGFQPGKTYRHKTEGWEGEYIGHKTQDIATNGKHKLENVPGFKITKPADDKNHPSNFLKEMWGEVSFDEMNDAETEDDGKGLMRKRREELVRKISATKEKLKTLDKTGEEAKKEKDKLKLMNEILQEFDDELSGKDSEVTNGRKPKFEQAKKTMFDQAKQSLKNRGYISEKGVLGHKMADLANMLRPHMTSDEVKSFMKEYYDAGIKSIQTFASRNNNKMPGVDRARMNKMMQKRKALDNYEHDMIDFRTALQDAMSPYFGYSHAKATPFHPEHYQFKDDSNKKQADFIAEIMSRAGMLDNGGIKKSALESFREGLAKAFGATRA